MIQHSLTMAIAYLLFILSGNARYDTTEPKPSLLEQARLQHYYQYTSSN
jgi:hypothetical protein